MNDDMIITDTIDADQIEVGDQILVDGDPIEVKSVDGDRNDPDAVVVTGYSHESGDVVEYSLPYNYSVDVWSI